MENVLIISSSKNASEVLSNFMKESFRCGIRTAETSYQAKNILDSVPSIELAVINSPLTDESGAGLAEYIIENTSASRRNLPKSTWIALEKAVLSL